MKPKLSLKGRGLQWLAQREHSRSELRMKLLRLARADFAAQQADQQAASPDPAACATDGQERDQDILGERPGPRTRAPAARLPSRPVPAPAAEFAASPVSAPAPSPEEAVDAVLDWLQAHQYLSDERFVESRVHARAARHGNLRIRQELTRHGVSLSGDAEQALKESEFARARDVWRRKFGEPPADASDRARQMRFLGGRGFSPEIIRRVVQGGACEDD